MVGVAWEHDLRHRRRAFYDVFSFGFSFVVYLGEQSLSKAFFVFVRSHKTSSMVSRRFSRHFFLPSDSDNSLLRCPLVAVLAIFCLSVLKWADCVRAPRVLGRGRGLPGQRREIPRLLRGTKFAVTSTPSASVVSQTPAGCVRGRTHLPVRALAT